MFNWQSTGGLNRFTTRDYQPPALHPPKNMTLAKSRLLVLPEQDDFDRWQEYPKSISLKSVLNGKSLR